MHTIPPDFVQFVGDSVASGKYRSEEEVVATALQLLREREQKLAALREDIRIGLEELDRGEGPVLDIGDTKRRGRKRLARKRTE